MKRKVIFRTDGNSMIGLGHVVRCCALADMIRENFDCYFSIRNPSAAIKQQVLEYASGIEVLDENISFEDEAELWTKQLCGGEIVVLDGYHFNTSYQQQIKSRGCKLVCIDDIHAYHFVADIIINHAPSATKKDYSKEPYTVVLAGSEYMLLKKPFLMAAQREPTKNFHQNILICFGGSDPNNITFQTLQEVRAQCNDSLQIVIGSANQYKNVIEDFVKNDDGQSQLHVALDSNNLLSLMNHCGTAIVSSSTIALEYICTKGRLFLRQTADNQNDLYNALIEKGCAYEYEKFFEGEMKDDDQMLFSQSKLVDGKSAERIKKVFLELSAAFLIKLAKAKKEDAEILFLWANEPSVRAQSHNRNKIDFEEHLSWFNRKLQDKSCFLYLSRLQEQSFGMIRFDLRDDEALISYLVDEKFRGKGLGKLVVKTGIETFLKETGFKGRITASVKNSNTPSIKVFRHLNFDEREDRLHKNSLVFVKQ